MLPSDAFSAVHTQRTPLETGPSMRFYAFIYWFLIFGAVSVSASRTPTAKRASSTPPINFVTTENGKFMVNGSALPFIGTNAYWLHALNTDEDIDATLGNISLAGFKVVRTWAFNDVETIPVNGTWFQLIANGTTMINNGTNGLQKLDKVVELAQKHGLYVIMSLTNNWNPRPLLDLPVTPITPSLFPLRDVTLGTNNSLPRNTLSNDYGGMDVYIRQFGGMNEHDQFYVNNTFIQAFQTYTTAVVSRYVNSPSVFSWEIANDPRCNSSLPASSLCETRNVTAWHATIAQHIKSVDPNHLVSSGHQGFFCASCAKLFPRQQPPPSQPSPAPGRRSAPKSLKKEQILKEKKEIMKKRRETNKKVNLKSGGIRIRGNWVSTPTRRQSPDDIGVGTSFDGSSGVDSEDIINIDDIGFGSFQLFPDQVQYSNVAPDPNLPAFNNTVNVGLDWIARHIQMGQDFGKPVSLTGFGLVTQNNSPFFVPFNSSIAPFAPDQVSNQTTTQPFGVTDAQRDDAYTQWLNAGIVGGLQGMIQYQWGQANLTAQPGTTIQPSITGTGISPNTDSTGQSPNDGYDIEGPDFADIIRTFNASAQRIAPDT